MPVDWLLLSRYALLVGLCELIPVPLLDGFVASRLRRRLVRIQLREREVEVSGRDLRLLAEPPGGGCLGLVWSVLIWPFQRLLRTVLFVLMINRIVNTVSEVVHRSLLVHEALEAGAVPGDAAAVRAAMQRALEQVDTTVVDRAVFAVLSESRATLWRLFRAVWRRTRAETRAEMRDERSVQPAPEEPQPLPAWPEEMSEALAEAVRAPGVRKELIEAFRSELAKPA